MLTAFAAALVLLAIAVIAWVAIHRALARLEREHKMARVLIDSIPDLMYVKDSASRFIIANSHMARTAGAKSPKDLIGKTDFDFFPHELASACFADEQHVVRIGQPLINREEAIVDRAGNKTLLISMKVPLKDSQGRVTGIACVGRNITKLKTAEKALREAERRYRATFDDAIVGIFQTTPDGHFLRVNRAMADILGYESPEEVIASLRDGTRHLYVAPKKRDGFVAAMREHGNIKNFECEIFRKDGSRIWISSTVRAICQGGAVIGHEGMSQDITERKRLQEQLFQAQKLESVGQLAAESRTKSIPRRSTSETTCAFWEMHFTTSPACSPSIGICNPAHRPRLKSPG